MGQIRFRAERNEQSNDALWTGFAEQASESQVRKALNFVRARRSEVEDAEYLVLLQAIRALHEQGRSVREIAVIVGISKSAVSRHLRTGVDGVAVRDSDEATMIIRQAWTGNQ